VSSLDSNVALLVAALDLKLVQLIRDAIRVTDIAGAKYHDGAGLGPAATFEPRRHLTPEPEYLPRRHIEPAPTFEPRKSIATCPPCHPAPAITPPPPPCECPPASSHPKSTFLLPPWKQLPWQNPPQPALKVKVIKLMPDIVRKGSLVDFFF
jgi:hypothetical protein